MRGDAKPASERTNWSQYWYPGPARRFSAAEMERAGSQPWPRMIDHMVLVNVIVLLAVTVQGFGGLRSPILFAGMLLLTWLGLRVAQCLWQHPTRKALNLLTYGAGVLFGVLSFVGIKTLGRDGMSLPMMLMAAWFFAVASGWWILVIFRVQQIESRLRELDDQRRHTALQTQLLQAQIQPHFLFNSLAALDHWVSSGDARATPLLRSLTGYLRATLPLFNREQLKLGEELAAVREYLAVMQARVGERLRVEIEIEPGVEEQLLPPALLLTLVENAIEHGVMPKLGAACVRIEARRVGGMTELSVSDDGPGLAVDAQSPSDGGHRGVGLANSRERLAQAFGAEARLTLANSAATGGCVATLSLPLKRNVAEGEHTQ